VGRRGRPARHSSALRVSREILQDAASDVFAMAVAEGWTDPLSRKALQFIERRQRNRAAIDKSPFAKPGRGHRRGHERL